MCYDDYEDDKDEEVANFYKKQIDNAYDLQAHGYNSIEEYITKELAKNGTVVCFEGKIYSDNKLNKEEK